MKKIKGRVRDMFSAFRVSSVYKKAVAEAPDTQEFPDPVSALVKRLHPGLISLRLTSREDLGGGCYFLTFESADKPIPPIKPGQYMTLTKRIGDSILTRPYTICSDSRNLDSISVLIKKMGGPLTEYMSTCPFGDTFISEIGLGTFYYEPLRDSKNVVLLVGGSGVTPAISMAYDAKDYHLTILFGVNSEIEIPLRDTLESLVGENVRLVYVIQDGGNGTPCEKGLITDKIIAKYMGEDPTFFVCGPRPMLDSMVKELSKLHISERRLRISPSPVPFPESENPSKEVFELTLHMGKTIQRIPARYDETLLTAFERAGIYVHSACRCGGCGFCRVKVISGDYHYLPADDGRRAADKELNYVHSCSAFPREDMELMLDLPAYL